VDHLGGARHEALMEIGFMPKALSTHPEPYRHAGRKANLRRHLDRLGLPAKDYDRWGELV